MAPKSTSCQLEVFSGMTIQEAANMMGISTATAERYWSFAQSWLYVQLNPGENE